GCEGWGEGGGCGGGGLGVGLLGGGPGGQDASVARVPGAMPTRLLVEPLTNFGVLRVRQDFGTNSSVGVLATAVNRFEPAGAAAPGPGDLCPVPYSTTFTTLVAPPPSQGRCTSDAYTAGLDATPPSAD